MREIKFRGQKVNTKEWIYGSLIITNNLYEICDDSTFSKWREEVETETVGQFTGIKDKNGKDIYEGDWLRVCVGYSSYVKYDSKQGCFLSIYSHPEDGEELLLGDLGNEVEIIGNVHQEK